MSAFSFAKIEVLDRVAIIVDENSSIEYAFTIPLGYIYFTLYKSIKTN